MKSLSIFMILAMIPTLVFAHGDHGNSFFTGIEHVMSNPVHFWPLIIALGLLLVALRRPLGQLVKKLRIKG